MRVIFRIATCTALLLISPTTFDAFGQELSWKDVLGVRLESVPDLPPGSVGHARQQTWFMTVATKPDFGRPPRRSTPSLKLEWAVARPRPGTWASLDPQQVDRLLPNLEQFAVETSFIETIDEELLSAAPPSTIVVSQASGAVDRGVPSKPVSLPVTLNYRALAERISSYNLSVAGIEDRLNSQEDWDLRSLETIVQQIDEVYRSRELWAMYWHVLGPTQQRQMGSVSRITSILEMVQQRIFETRVAVDIDPDRVSHLSARRIRARLAELDKKVDIWIQRQPKP